MKIHFFGAAGGQVTGSCHVVETRDARVMVDCGLFQGGKECEALNYAPMPDSERLDAVLLTHGHLDHTGRLPLVARHGCPILGTPATLEMSALILRDSARLQVADNERRNRKRERAGEPPLEPLYTPEDAEEAIARLRPAPYNTPLPVAPGISAVWAESGHMLGSASIQLLVEEEGRTKRVVFSGDIGPRSAPILREFEPFHEADAVVLESTYGGRDHRDFAQTVEEFEHIVMEAVASGGKILVPTFAVGRAQLIMLLLAGMLRAGKVKPFPMFLDSPMAIEATRIYAKHLELFDEQMMEFIRERPLREDLTLLQATASADESRAINSVRGTCLIMAGAGMCNAGRIVHHLKANLWKPDTHVVIVGFQGQGSLGRLLVDGAESVKIFGEKIAVKARVHTLGGFSAHAGQSDLMHWFEAIAPSRPRVILNHGEDDQRSALAELIRQRHGLAAELPRLGDVIEV